MKGVEVLAEGNFTVTQQLHPLVSVLMDIFTFIYLLTYWFYCRHSSQLVDNIGRKQHLLLYLPHRPKTARTHHYIRIQFYLPHIQLLNTKMIKQLKMNYFQTDRSHPIPSMQCTTGFDSTGFIGTSARWMEGWYEIIYLKTCFRIKIHSRAKSAPQSLYNICWNFSFVLRCQSVFYKTSL